MDTKENPNAADPVLKSVVQLWLTKLEKAKRHKKGVFQDDADECQSFFNGPRSWDELMGGRAGMDSPGDTPELAFKMRVNKAFELVTIYGPALYYQVPVRTVNPRKPTPIPPDFLGNPQLAMAYQQQEATRVQADAMRSAVLAGYLNWTPRENQLDVESRQAIEEALVKGRGCLWTELREIPGSEVVVSATTFDSVDNLEVDPDAASIEEAAWIARRCVHPVWQVERDFGIAPGTLKGNLESQAVQGEVSFGGSDAEFERKRGTTSDLITYWKIYSKMGIGGRLSGVSKGLRGPLEMFGDYCYIAVAKDVPYPLNLPPSVQQAVGDGSGPPQDVFDRVAWPTPYWRKDGEWPMTPLDFHRVPNCPWPMSHLKAGLGELKFLNWMLSFVAGKIRNTCRDFVALSKDLGEEIKTSILNGPDLTMLEIEPNNGKVADLVSFLQHPEMNGDIWKVIEAMEANFDKRVGLNELMYGNGGGTQIRSAQEAEVRNQNSNVRPEDMAKQVEAWMSRVAAKEAACSRLHLRGSDVLPILGQMAAMAWDQFVHTDDATVAMHQLEYSIEAGSTRRANKDTQVQRTSESVQTILPLLQQYAVTTGDIGPINNLLSDWASARDLDPSRYQMRQPMIAPMPAAPAPGQHPPGRPAA